MTGDPDKLSPEARAEARRSLDAIARRRLAERLARERELLAIAKAKQSKPAR